MSNDSLSTDSASLRSLLSNTITTHFNDHFKDRPIPNIDWGIPNKTSVIHRLSVTSSSVSLHHNATYDEVVSMVHEAKWFEAAQALRPLVNVGDPDADQLMNVVLKRLQADCKPHAQKDLPTMLGVPASNYNACDNKLVLHRYLRFRNAPRFVLVYLVFHECARIQYGIINDETVTPAFLSMEPNAPQRNRAHEWLSHHGFPVFQLNHEIVANECANYFKYPINTAWMLQ